MSPVDVHWSALGVFWASVTAGHYCRVCHPHKLSVLSNSSRLSRHRICPLMRKGPALSP